MRNQIKTILGVNSSHGEESRSVEPTERGAPKKQAEDAQKEGTRVCKEGAVG